jgi:DNA replication ATP-dependent helicase Dna2
VHAVVQPAPVDAAFKSFARFNPKTQKDKRREGAVPFEIKTGRATAGMEHRAQTMLYTLLLSERTSTPVPSGLLYYTQTEEVMEVPAARNEVKSLIGVRNSLAGWVSKRGRKWDKEEKERRERARLEVKIDEEGEELIDSKSNETQEVDDGPFLPLPIDDERTCTRCYAIDTCMLFRRVSLLPMSAPLGPAD